MSELASRRQRDRDNPARRTVTCFCDSCERILYVDLTDAMFCPVCSSTVMVAQGLRDDEPVPNV